jgi:hypothetical protein
MVPAREVREKQSPLPTGLARPFEHVGVVFRQINGRPVTGESIKLRWEQVDRVIERLPRFTFKAKLNQRRCK